MAYCSRVLNPPVIFRFTAEFIEQNASPLTSYGIQGRFSVVPCCTPDMFSRPGILQQYDTTNDTSLQKNYSTWSLLSPHCGTCRGHSKLILFPNPFFSFSFLHFLKLSSVYRNFLKAQIPMHCLFLCSHCTLARSFTERYYSPPHTHYVEILPV